MERIVWWKKAILKYNILWMLDRELFLMRNYLYMCESSHREEHSYKIYPLFNFLYRSNHKAEYILYLWRLKLGYQLAKRRWFDYNSTLSTAKIESLQRTWEKSIKLFDI